MSRWTFAYKYNIYFKSKCGVLSGEAINTNFLVFGLTQPELEPMIYPTWVKHANYYITDEIYDMKEL
jgi:hypothetical protein